MLDAIGTGPPISSRTPESSPPSRAAVGSSLLDEDSHGGPPVGCLEYAVIMSETKGARPPASSRTPDWQPARSLVAASNLSADGHHRSPGTNS